MVKLSTVCTGRLYLQDINPGTRFRYRLSRLQGHSAAGGIWAMKNFNGPLEDRTRNLPASSALFKYSLKNYFCKLRKCKSILSITVDTHRPTSVSQTRYNKFCALKATSIKYCCKYPLAHILTLYDIFGQNYLNLTKSISQLLSYKSVMSKIN